ncbi:MAG: DNA-binding protein [Oscillospiraceae bacterium]|nr:DNA-binding protein [Oscillospiraceae bacterium]
MKTYAVRLRRGADLLKSIEELCTKNAIRAGVVLSAVGCVSRGRVRDAGGVNIVDIAEPLEIVSLMGTVSHTRCHLHVSFSKEDLSVVGGHLVTGCIINTTCELIIGELENCVYDVEFDEETGYDELIFKYL